MCSCPLVLCLCNCVLAGTAQLCHLTSAASLFCTPTLLFYSSEIKKEKTLISLLQYKTAISHSSGTVTFNLQSGMEFGRYMRSLPYVRECNVNRI